MRRIIVNEIAERRMRSTRPPILTPLLDRMSALQTEFAKRDSLGDEMLRYFPIACVAMMEGYFREIIQELVDSGPPYADRIDALLDGARVDLQVLKAIHGRSITTGEFVAHMVPLSNFDDVNRGMTALIGTDFAAAIRECRDRFAKRKLGAGAAPLLPNPGSVFDGVKSAYRLRHIFAHELASGSVVSRSEIETAFASVIAFLETTYELIIQVQSPDGPLTQREMRAEAERQLRTAERELKVAEEAALATMSAGQRRRLLAAQKRWVAARDGLAILHADLTGGARDAFWEVMYYEAAVELTYRRTDELFLVISHRYLSA